MKRFVALLVLIALAFVTPCVRAQGIPFVSAQGNTGSNNWHVGGAGGPIVFNNAGNLEAKNAAGSGFTILRASPPVGSNDLVTLGYLNGTGGTVGGDATGTTIGLQVTGIHGSAIPSLSNGCLTSTGGVLTWGSCGGGGTSVMGTGLWYSATGTLNGAAVGFSGDATFGALSGGNLPITFATVNSNVGTFGSGSTIPIITVNAKGLTTAVTTATVAAALGSATGTLSIGQLGHGTAAQVLQTNAGATSAVWNTFSQDVTVNSTGVTTVNSISGTSPIPITPNTLQWVQTATAPTISQAAQTTDTATFNMTLAPQAPFGSATTNKTGGSLIVNLPAPVSGGTESTLTVQRNGTITAMLGADNSGNPTWGELWLGNVTHNRTNVTLIGDSANTALNAPVSSLFLEAAGTSRLTLYSDGNAQFFNAGTEDAGGGTGVIGISPALTDFASATSSGVALSVPAHNALELNGNLFEFSSFQGNPKITQMTPGASTPGNDMFVHAQNGGSSASGGNLWLEGGQSGGGGAAAGSAILTDGSLGSKFEVNPASAGSFLLFGTDFFWDASNSGVFIKQNAQISDVATTTFQMRAQSAFASATTNKVGGAMIVFGGGGTDLAHSGSGSIYAGDQTTGISALGAYLSTTTANSLVQGYTTFGSGLASTITDDVVSEGQNNVNSQSTNKQRIRSFCRLVGNTTTTCATITVPTGVQETAKITYMIRDVTHASAANDASGEILISTHNVAGTVAQVGSSAVALQVVGSSFLGAVTNILLTVVPSGNQFAINMQLQTATDTYDVVLDGEYPQN